MQDNIREVLAADKKSSYTDIIRRVPGLWDWINIQIGNNFPNEILSNGEKIYLSLNLSTDLYCTIAGRKHYGGFRRGFVCNRWCECTRKKRKSTCVKKYGVENPGQSAKALANHKEFYDDEEKVKKITERTKNTYKARTGYEYPIQNPIVKEKTKVTCKEKFNSKYAISSKHVREESKKTMNQRYGVDYGSQIPKAKEKGKKTRRINNLKRIGRISTSQRHISLESLEILDTKEKFTEMLLHHTRQSMANALGVEVNIISTRHKLFDLDMLYKRSNAPERSISTWLDENNIIWRRDRKICGRKELDFVIPDSKLAIEHNGLYWHSEFANGKGNEYHQIKTNQCKNAGLELVHLFGDEWEYKRDICKSIILAKIGKFKTKIAARKCVIKEVNAKEIRSFLDENHLQGFIGANKYIVLEYNNEIVAAMTFGKPRYNKNVEWELLRLANKLNTQIIGGTQKLWNYFIKTYRPSTVVSYCDRRWFTGKIYENLNFIKSKDAIPTYWYTNYKQRWHRSKFTKQNCIKAILKMKDNTYSEELLQEMMEKDMAKDILGLDRIWDCGQDSWIWNSTSGGNS